MFVLSYALLAITADRHSDVEQDLGLSVSFHADRQAAEAALISGLIQVANPEGELLTEEEYVDNLLEDGDIESIEDFTGLTFEKQIEFIMAMNYDVDDSGDQINYKILEVPTSL